MFKLLSVLGLFLGTQTAKASDLKVGDAAPLFKTKTHEGKDFDLSTRKGKWTVLFFYPKADTPGCTKQACAFRDNVKKIQVLDAGIFGISGDTVEAQANFHKKYKLNFDLLSDADAKVIELYGSKMPMLKISKRWTFIIDPDLKIRSIEKDVDPALDAEKVAAQISKFKNPN